MLQIVSAPSPVLAKIAKPVPIKSGTVEKIDKSVQKFITNMKIALANTRDPQGVGLAAPQVGKPLQIFIMQQTPKSPVTVYINPVVTPLGDAMTPNTKDNDGPVKLEGCLSLPRIWGTVSRYQKVKIEYLDEEGKRHTKTVGGFLAVIMQHEYDHLHGILFPKRVLEQKGKLYKSKKDAKGNDVFDEMEL